MFGSRVGFLAELRFLPGAFIHALLSRVTLASARLSCIEELIVSFNIQKCAFLFTHRIIINNYYNLLSQKSGFGFARPVLAYFQSSK